MDARGGGSVQVPAARATFFTPSGETTVLQVAGVLKREAEYVFAYDDGRELFGT